MLSKKVFQFILAMTFVFAMILNAHAEQVGKSDAAASSNSDTSVSPSSSKESSSTQGQRNVDQDRGSVAGLEPGTRGSTPKFSKSENRGSASPGSAETSDGQ